MKKIKKVLLSSMLLAFLFSIPASAEWTGEVKGDTWGTLNEFQLTGGVSGKKVTTLSSGKVDKDVSALVEYWDSKPQVEVSASLDGKNASALYWSKSAYRNSTGEKEIVAVLKADGSQKWSKNSGIVFKMASINAMTEQIEIELGASKDGPRDYKIEYSLDGKTYYPLNAEKSNTTSIKESYTIAAAFTENIADIQRTYETLTIKENVKGKEIESDLKIYDDIYFKISVASDYKVNGKKGLYGSSTGEMAVRAIHFQQKSATAEGDEGTFIDTPTITDDVAAPTKVTAYKTAAYTATLTWKKADSADGYEIYLKKGNSSYKKVKTLKNATYKIKDLSNKGTYKIRIRSYKVVNGKKYYSSYTKAITLKMKEQLLPKDLSINKKITVKVGGQKKLALKCASGKNDKLIKNVKYKVKNNKIASVQSGIVKGKKTGSTTVRITVTLKSGLSKTFTTKIQVKK